MLEQKKSGYLSYAPRMFGSMPSNAHQAHIALSEPMISIVQQSSSLSSSSISPSLIPTIIDLTVIDLVSCPVWWEAETNNAGLSPE